MPGNVEEMRCTCVEEIVKSFSTERAQENRTCCHAEYRVRHFLKLYKNFKLSESRAMACKSNDVCSGVI